jgi:hypothetical protein
LAQDTNDPVLIGVRHHVRERFGGYNLPALGQIMDWLIAEHGLTPDQAEALPLPDVLARLRAGTAGADHQQPDLEQHMKRIAQAVGDDNTSRILAVAQRTGWSGEQKMEEIVRLDKRFAGKNSTEWGTLLGVSAAAVRGYGLWKRLQEAKKSDD